MKTMDGIRQKANVVYISFLLATSAVFFRFKIVAALHLAMYLVCAIIFVAYLLCKKEIHTQYKNMACLFLWAAVGVVHFFFSGNPSDNTLIYYVLFFSLPLFYAMLPAEQVRRIGSQDFLRAIEKVIVLWLVYLAVEVCVRMFLNFQARGTIWYAKFHSFAYSDTNFLALTMLYFSCLVRYLCCEWNMKQLKKYHIILIFLELLTFSRSVIITQFAVLYIEFCYRFVIKRKNFLLLLVNLVCIVAGVVLLFHFLHTDTSGQTKLGVIKGLLKIKDQPLKNQLFGFGFGKGEYAYSYLLNGHDHHYGHLHIALLLGQVGIVGLVLYVALLIRYLQVSGGKIFYLLFAFALSGCSLAFFDSSFYYCIGIICVLEKLRVQNKPCIEGNLLCI